jgi:hypothetical protein
MKKQFYIAGFLCITICVSLTGAQNFMMSAESDLNNDGTTDSIRLSEVEETGAFTLTAGTAKISRTFEGGEAADGLIIVDVDKTDNYKEIAVHTPGSSDDHEFYVFWYDGTSLHEMAYLSMWPTFYENGIVNVDTWMGFWSKREKYVLNKKTRKLYNVAQGLYYVGVEAKVRESFSIYKTRTGSDVVANLKTNSTCFIMVCDTSPAKPMSDWYLIKSTTGLVGWAREKTVYDKLELPLAD